MKIKLEHIWKSYEKLDVVKDVSLIVEDKEIMVLLGPSGCGKTTLLRLVAGLIPLSKGQILFDYNDVSKLSSQKRNTAMVFQNYALFPHMNVEENIAFGLKVRRFSKSETRKRVEKILQSVELDGMGKRKVQELSGGQQQRVALARALIIQPDILLFDEPLSNLDEKLRVSMRQNIKKLQREFGITSIYVTHDQEEAMAVADRITVMNLGEIQQISTPKELYLHPVNEFVANFVGQVNLFETYFMPISDNWGEVEILGIKIQLPASKALKGEVTAMIRPENFIFSQDGVLGKVIFKEDLGLVSRYQIQIKGKSIGVDILNCVGAQVAQMGESVRISFNSYSVHLLEKP